jgi:ArsR family metal-binding transcriptional regulator
MDIVVAFPRSSEFEKAKSRMDSARLSYGVLTPDPGYSLVGAPALICDPYGVATIQSRDEQLIAVAGWVDRKPATIAVPQRPPPEFQEDIFGRAVIMFLGPCMADVTKVRLIAHISGDLTAVLPHLNSEIRSACYNATSVFLTFMDKHRLITLYPRRVTIGKADDLVDGWRTLEFLRVLANTVWARRAAIPPSYDMKSKPPALEIYKRLPRTNCKACGERTCMAFAIRLWRGEATPSQCEPVFSPEHARLRGALIEICRGLGVVGSEMDAVDV